MHKVGDFLTGALVLAGVYLATKPGSQGSRLVSAIGGAFSGIIATSTGQTRKR
jgi:hypothetical protein